MRAIRFGAPVLALALMAAAGAAGQEAMPVLPDIGAAGAPAASAGTPLVVGGERIAPRPIQGENSRGVTETVAVDVSAAGEPPPGGSRLLRALADAVSPQHEAAPGTPPAPGTLRVFAAEGCPRALLRRLLAGAAGEADAVAALAIETELLTLCSERQRIVTALFETEAQLAELRTPAEPPPAAETAPPVPRPAAAAAEPERAAEPEPAPSALRQALAATPEAETAAAPALGWFSIVGSAGALRAGITDGAGVWFVREGDALPGGGTVAAIAGRPPAVRMSGPEGEGEEPLPFRAHPGGAR